MNTLKNLIPAWHRQITLSKLRLLATAFFLLLWTLPAGAVITYLSGSTGGLGGGPVSSVSITPPAGVLLNDVMLVRIGIRANSCAAINSVPAGWSSVQCQSSGTLTQAVYYKLAGASETSPYTWGFNSNYRAGASLSVFRGTDTTAPIMTSASAGGSGTSVDAPTVNVTAADAMLVGFFASGHSGGSPFTQPAGMTEVVDVGDGAGPNGVGFSADYEPIPGTGNTGPRTAIASMNASWVGISVVLRMPVILDHIRLEHTGSGVTCTSSAVTVKACADAACTTLYSGGTTTVTLSPATGWASNPIAFTGSTTTSLSVTTPSTVTLGTSAASPTPSGTSPQCYVGATATCSHTFADTGFIFSSAANGAEATIPAQTAGVSSGTYYLRAVRTGTSTQACEAALAGANTVEFAHECNNPTTCSGSNLMSVNGGTATTIARNNNGSVTSYTPVSMTFDANGNAPFTFNYSDVGQVKLHARKTASGTLLKTLTGSSNAFVVKPFGFTVSNIQRTSDSFANPAAANATGTAFIKAGSSFTATVTAIANGGTATPNYGREIVPEGVLLTPALVAGLGLTNNPALTNGTIAGAEFGSGGAVNTDANGVATVTNLAWNEVGIITLTPSVGDADYLGAGNVTGTTTGNVGRFYPDHFALSAGSIANRTDISPACSPASSFTYMGEPFQASFTLTAQGPAPGNATLLNYVTSGVAANNFAKLATGTPIPAGFGLAYLDGTTNLTARVDSSLGITGSWAAGVLNATATLGFTRDTAPDGPYNAMKVGIAPVDSDGAALNTFNMDVTAPAGNDHAEVGQTQIRFGRLRLSNAHGSELLALPIPISVQYWNGTLFTTHTADSCTSLSSSNIGLGNYKNNLASGETSVNPATISFVSGVGTMRLTAPGAGNSGSVDLCVDLGSDPVGGVTCSAAASAGKSYLQGKWAPGTAWDNDPKVRATFGVYKNANEFIYLREMY